MRFSKMRAIGKRLGFNLPLEMPCIPFANGSGTPAREQNESILMRADAHDQVILNAGSEAFRSCGMK